MQPGIWIWGNSFIKPFKPFVRIRHLYFFLMVSLLPKFLRTSFYCTLFSVEFSHILSSLREFARKFIRAKIYMNKVYLGYCRFDSSLIFTSEKRTEAERSLYLRWDHSIDWIFFSPESSRFSHTPPCDQSFGAVCPN